LFSGLKEAAGLERRNIIIIAPDHAFLEPPALWSLYQHVVVNRGFDNGRRDVSRVEEKEVH